MKAEFSDVRCDLNQILVESGQLITAGGMMSWMDLVLALIAKFAGEKAVRQIGEQWVIDTRKRSHASHRPFDSKLSHRDRAIQKTQRFLLKRFSDTVAMSDLAKLANLSLRTFYRRFKSATGVSPHKYLQDIRLREATLLLEQTDMSFDEITRQVGYEDPTSFRELFKSQLGVLPSGFR